MVVQQLFFVFVIIFMCLIVLLELECFRVGQGLKENPTSSFSDYTNKFLFSKRIILVFFPALLNETFGDTH